MVLLFVLAIFNCRSKDEEEILPPVFPEENPMSAYIANTGFSTTTNIINSDDTEFGLIFSPKVTGKITAITGQIPVANEFLRFTIWDFQTGAILRTEILTVKAANTLTTRSIEELTVVKDKKYMISMNTNDWYRRKKPDGRDASYPIDAGNIKFLYFVARLGNDQILPSVVQPHYYAGDFSFIFQQTE